MRRWIWFGMMLFVISRGYAMESSTIQLHFKFDLSDDDSSLLACRQMVMDSVKQWLQASPLSTFRFQIDIETADASDDGRDAWSEPSLPQKAPTSARVQLIVVVRLSYDENQAIILQPFFFEQEPVDSANWYGATINSLSGKSCRLRQFALPAMASSNLVSLKNFLCSYLLFDQKKYDEAIALFRTNSSMPEYFYLAESYLQRGVWRERDVTAARADWDSSIIYFKKALSRARLTQDSLRVQNNLAVTFQFLGELDSARQYFSVANEKLALLNDRRDRIRLANNFGNIHLLTGRWKQALDVFQSSLSDVEQSSDSLLMAETYENLGNIYQLITQRNKAIAYYHHALEIWQALHNDAGLATCYYALGNAHAAKGELDAAKDYFQQSLTLSVKLHHEPHLAEVYDLLGQVWQDMGQVDSARTYYQKSIAMYAMLDDQPNYVRALMHQASLFQKQKLLDSAMVLYKKAQHMAVDKNTRSLQAQICDRLGDVFNSQSQLDSAYVYYKKSADLYEQAANFESLSLILFNMGLIRLKQNDHADGYELIKRAISLDDEYGFHNLTSEREFLKELELILKD
ncbi:MAG: tetratricopeptide repeat protein [candidate division KSB1 bacterium]|nr:tetratricopeptide repeat protein [candidate division KSB1 bacterium]